jgi:hypothetical protein
MKITCIAALLLAATGCGMSGNAFDDRAKQMQAAVDAVHPAKVVPPQNFAEAQKLGWEGARARGAAMSPPATILRVYPIYGYDWGNKMGEHGLPEREARIMVVYKGGATGFCRQEDTNVSQENVNGTWTRPVVVLGQMGFHIDCGDVDKFPGGE